MNRTFFRHAASAGLAAALGAASVSCQKVVSIDLNNANPQMVAEAIVTDGPGPYTVTLTKSGDYFSPSLYFPPVTHAFVTIADNLGVTDTLKETSAGTYRTSVLHGSQGKSYALRIVAEGKEYDAVSTMPAQGPHRHASRAPFP